VLAALAAGRGFGQTAIDLRTQSKSVDFSAASSTRPLKTGTSLPATCTAGEMFFKTDAPAGSNLYGCTAANSWSLQAGGGGSMGPGTPNASQSFTAQTTVTIVHDLNSLNVIVQCYDTASRAIEYNSVTVTNANQVVVTFQSPQSGRCVVNGTGGGTTVVELQPSANASQSFTAQTSVTVAHNLNSLNVIAQCYDATNKAIDYHSMTVTDANHVAVAFQAPQSGRCVVNGTGGTGGTGGGSGEATTAANVGTGGTGIFSEKSGSELQFKNLNSGSNRISVSNDATNREVDIDVVPNNIDIATLGGLFSPSQVGSGNKQGNGTRFQMFGGGTPAANDCAKFDASGNLVSAGAACGTGGGGSGESNTASNQGVGGIGVYLQKSGVDLQFKNINAGSNRVSVTNDTANREVDVDVQPANLDLAALGGSLAASQIATASKQGTGTKVQMYSGAAPAADACAKFDAAGNLVSSGAPCGGGGSGDAISSDLGISVVQAGAGLKRVGVDTATVPTFLTGVAPLDFASISQNTCAELTFSLPGAYTADAVAPGWPLGLESGLIGLMYVSAQNTVSVRLCKITSGSVDPLNQNFRATIVRSF
jgi:hypothetical protein